MTGREEENDQKRRRGRVRRTVKLVSMALLGYAVVEELRKPKDQRTWHGALFGWLPYDLRMPTPTRIKATLWAPEDERLLVPRVFGVGWSPNLGRVAHLVRERTGSGRS